MPNVPELATVAQLEGILDLSRQNVYKHIRRAGLQPAMGRRYRSREVLEAIVRHRADDKRLKTTGASPELRAKKLQLETEILDTRLRQLEAELVPLHIHRANNFRIARMIRDAILALPDRLDELLAAEADPHAVRRILDEELRAILERLHHALERDPEAAETAPELEDAP